MASMQTDPICTYDVGLPGNKKKLQLVQVNMHQFFSFILKA